MDTDFSVWRDKKISKGLKQWDEQDKMICDCMDPCKEAKYPDPLGTPMYYMESCDVFKPIKTSEYDLCHFYQVGLTGDFPEFPEPCKPMTSNHMCGLLTKAQMLSWPNLLAAHSQDMVTAVCLLRELLTHVSLRCFKMETNAEAGDKTKWKLSFFPFCQYSGSSDPSYLNHIICAHYNANYECGKCLDEVFITRQQLSKHMKGCKVVTTDEVEKPTSGHMKGAPSSSGSKKKKKKHKTKSQPSDSQLAPQTLLPTSSHVSSHMSPHHSKCAKKKTAAATPKKLHPSSKDLGEKCSLSHKHFSKKDQMLKSDKHKKNEK